MPAAAVEASAPVEATAASVEAASPMKTAAVRATACETMETISAVKSSVAAESANGTASAYEAAFTTPTSSTPASSPTAATPAPTGATPAPTTSSPTPTAPAPATTPSVPRACANEDASHKPVRSVVAIGRTSIRIISVVAVGAYRRRANITGTNADTDGDLRLRGAKRQREKTDQSQIFYVPHNVNTPFTGIQHPRPSGQTRSFQIAHI